MLVTPSIVQIPVAASDVYAFRIRGKIARDDLHHMAETMNTAFDAHGTVSMLLVFDDYDGTETGAGMDFQTLTSQFRSIAKVDKYAVVGAPTLAATMITVMDKLMPTDARTFPTEDEALAWAFVGTHAIEGGAGQ
jgi:hypothetical protein